MKQVSRVIRTAFAAVAGIALAATLARAESKVAEPVASKRVEGLEKQWGIQVTSLRLSANGYMIDFRYKVLDPDKAAELADPDARPYLLDQSTGIKLPVPKTPKIGPLRQTAQKPAAGKVYFVLFANPGQLVKPGGKVTVTLGDFRAEDLVVQ